jgi:N-acetylglucosaminyl-diphospho-decaprenol L-rhamnosyltransferase
VTDLAVIIVSYNTRGDLERCLQSLVDAPPEVAHEITVVDNASEDGSAEMARQIRGVRVIEAGGNLGFGRANNVGIRASASELILLLNSDTLVPEGAIDCLVADLRTHPEVAAVGPRLVDGEGRPEISFGRMLGPFAEAVQKTLGRFYAAGWRPARRYVERRTSVAHEPDWVSGACLLVRRAEAEAAGLFDERYFMYAEDVDFCAALRSRGGRIRFSPSAEIAHYRGQSGARHPATTSAAYRRSQVAFYEKHHPGWARWLRLYLRLRGQMPHPAQPL